MSDKATEESLQALVLGADELQSLSEALREQLSDGQQRSSPARRWAAYHSDIVLVGRSQAFVEVMTQVASVSNTDSPVLLNGEPGTGKELIASAIHHRSNRSDKPFVSVKCDAIENRQSLWEEAGGGTVFLNEITQTTPSVQEQLLSVLEMGEANPSQKVDVRVIAASSRNLDQEVASGRFRPDLFSRLKAVSIVLPPLRERREDIRSLAESFAARVYSLSPPVKFSTEALSLLERYSWPGNMRELENVVVRAVAMCDGAIRLKDLPQRVRNYTQKNSDPSSASTANGERPREEWVPLSEVEARYVTEVLQHTRGNKQAAARVLAVDRKTLDRMIKRHNIDAEKTRRTRG